MRAQANFGIGSRPHGASSACPPHERKNGASLEGRLLGSHADGRGLGTVRSGGRAACLRLRRAPTPRAHGPFAALSLSYSQIIRFIPIRAALVTDKWGNEVYDDVVDVAVQESGVVRTGSLLHVHLGCPQLNSTI